MTYGMVFLNMVGYGSVAMIWLIALYLLVERIRGRW